MNLLSNNPRVWPTGDTSTYRSYDWQGYWIPTYGCLGTYDTNDVNKNLIGGGSLPGQPAPAGYNIGVFDSLWTLQIGETLCCIPGSTLPPATGHENELYQVLLRSDAPVPGVIATADSPNWLFENLDWIYSDGTNWIRVRDRGTQSETSVFNLGRRVFESIDTGIHDDFLYTGIVGAGYILYNNHAHNYVIGMDGSDWTRVIGGRVKANLTAGGWYDYLASQSMEGYGPSAITNHSAVTLDPMRAGLSPVYDWSTEPGIGNPTHPPFFRAFEFSPTEFLLYMQVPEEAIEEDGVTISFSPGFNLIAASDAIKLHYYNVSVGDWSTSTNVELPSSSITEGDITLKMIDIPAIDPHDPLSPIRKRLRLWNGNRPRHVQDPFSAESADLDPLQDSLHQVGKVLLSFRVSYGGVFGSMTNYLEGVAIKRENIEITAA